MACPYAERGGGPGHNKQPNQKETTCLKDWRSRHRSSAGYQSARSWKRTATGSPRKMTSSRLPARCRTRMAGSITPWTKPCALLPAPSCAAFRSGCCSMTRTSTCVPITASSTVKPAARCVSAMVRLVGALRWPVSKRCLVLHPRDAS